MKKKDWSESVAMLAVLLAVSVSAGFARGGRKPQKSVAEKPAFHEILSQPLPVLDGGHVKLRIVEVDVVPGASSPPHSHPCPVIAYEEQGAVVSKVKGQPPRSFLADQTFYEAPNGVHEVARNASATSPAKPLAVLVCDHQGPLSTPPPGDK